MQQTSAARQPTRHRRITSKALPAPLARARARTTLVHLGVAAALATGLVACGSTPSTTSTAKSGSSPATTGATANAAPSTVHVEATLNLVSAPLFIALGPDFLGQVAQQFHTQFAFTPGTAANVQVANLLGGVDQFYTPVTPAILPPIAAGKDVKLINQVSLNGTQLLIGAAKYKTSRGTNLAAYGSGTWCYAAPGSASESALQAAATSVGLNWSKIHGVSLGSSTAFLPTMRTGECDLSAEDATDAAKAISEGIGYVVQNQTVESVSNQVFGSKAPLIGDVLATTGSFAGKYPALTQAFDTALVKAELYMAYHASDPALLYSKMASVYKAKNTEADFAAQWHLVSASFTIGSGMFAMPSVDATINYLKSAGSLHSAGSSVNAAFVNSYTTKAYSSLGLPQPASDGSIPSNRVLQQHSTALGL